MKNTMEDDTTKGMASSLHSYIGRDPRALVHRPGDAQALQNGHDYNIIF
jgi:hypothetical protein